MWKVYRGNVWTGIVETNFEWASKYWPPRGYKLVQG